MQFPNLFIIIKLMKKKVNPALDTLLKLIIIVNIIYVFFVALYLYGIRFDTNFATGFIAMYAISLSFIFISTLDLIALLYYIFRHRPKGISRILSYITLIPLATFFITITAPLGVDWIIKYVRSSIPISNIEAIRLITNCKVTSLDNYSDSVSVAERDEKWGTYRTVENGNFDQLLSIVQTARHTCIDISAADYTFENYKYHDKSNYHVKNNFVYFAQSLIFDADYKTFMIIDDAYAKDRNHVYFLGDIVENADPARCIPENISGCYGD